MNEKTIGQKVLIIIAIVLIIACLFVSGWWLLVELYGPGKTVIDTMNSGQIKLVDGSDKRYIFEVNYYSNDNKNGLEMLEIKINYYKDEKRESFYSQGLQFVANSINDSISFKYVADDASRKEMKFWSKSRWFGSYSSLKNGTIHNYASSDNYQTTLGSFEKIDVNASFRISLTNKIETDDGIVEEEQMYLLKFQGTDTQVNDAYKHGSSKVLWYTGDFYSYNDIYLMSRNIYSNAKTMQRGTNHATAVEFLDFFSYSKFDGNTYVDMTKEDTNKVKSQIVSYFVIKFNVSADGAKKASDSMFNNIKGSPTFNLTGDYTADDYYIGRTVMNLTNNMFDYVEINSGCVALKLKPEYLNYYSKYKDDICLSITIDKDKLKEQELEFVGFTADSGLDQFHIKECKTTETTNGQVVESEVQL